MFKKLTSGIVIALAVFAQGQEFECRYKGPEPLRQEITDAKPIVDSVKKCLDRKVAPPSTVPAVARTVFLNGCIDCRPDHMDSKTIKVRIDFEPQTIDGYPIEGPAPLVVFANAQGITATQGELVQENIVNLRTVTEKEAKAKLVGRHVSMNDKRGKPITQEIQPPMLLAPAYKVVMSSSFGHSRAYLAWKIRIGECWTAYVGGLKAEFVDIRTDCRS